METEDRKGVGAPTAAAGATGAAGAAAAARTTAIPAAPAAGRAGAQAPTPAGGGGARTDDGSQDDAGPRSPWAALSDTQRALVLTLLRHGRLSRPEIMEQVGISPGSVTRLTAPLVDEGLLLAGSAQVASTGRPQSPLEVNAAAESLIGVTLSRRSLTAVLTDLRLGVLSTARRRVADHDPGTVVDLVAEAVEELRRSRPQGPPPTCLGLSLGGGSADGRTVDGAGLLGWGTIPLAEMVEARTALPTRVGNDVTALALHEAWFGVGRDHSRFTLVTVGAGVGHGLVVDGSVISSPDAERGLVGAVPVPDDAPPDAPPASPGAGASAGPGEGAGAATRTTRSGAAPALPALVPAPASPVASSPAGQCLTDAALERAWMAAGGPPATAAEVVARAADGEARALAVCGALARRLGRFIGLSAAFTLPEVVVVAGERAAVASLLVEEVLEGLTELRPAGADELEIVVREHERAHWARGAAALALQARVTGAL